MPKFKDKLFYGWVVVAAFLVIGTVLDGVRLSFGVFFKSIGGEFNLTRAATSAILSTSMALAGVSAFFAGWAVDRYGPRIVLLLMGLFTGLSLLLTSQTNSAWQLFITYSLLLSMGTGATYVVSMSIVTRWFDKNRGVALGIAGSGAGLGAVIMAPFATYLISNFDWRTAYIVMGLITWLIVIPLSRLLKKDPHEIGALPDGVNAHSEDMKSERESIQMIDFSLLQAFRTRSFWLMILIWLFFASSFLLVLTHIVPHATDIGLSAGEAATVLSLIGGASIAGKVVMGSVSDRVGRKTVPCICSLLGGGAMVWLIWSQDLWMFYLFALVYGFAAGGMTAGMSVLIGDTFELGKIGAIFGVLEISWGIGAAIGPAIGGLIFDVSNSYFMAFLIGAVVMLVTPLFVVPIKPVKLGPGDLKSEHASSEFG